MRGRGGRGTCNKVGLVISWKVSNALFNIHFHSQSKSFSGGYIERDKQNNRNPKMPEAAPVPAEAAAGIAASAKNLPPAPGEYVPLSRQTIESNVTSFKYQKEGNL